MLVGIRTRRKGNYSEAFLSSPPAVEEEKVHPTSFSFLFLFLFLRACDMTRENPCVPERGPSLLCSSKKEKEIERKENCFIFGLMGSRFFPSFELNVLLLSIVLQ